MLVTQPDSWPYSHHDLVAFYQDQYDRQIASGEYQPCLYPWEAWGALVAIGYLLIPHQHRPWLRKARFLVFAWIAGFAGYTVRYVRARLIAASYGVGIISAWSVVWAGAILICNDAQTDFMRIERREGVFDAKRSERKEGLTTKESEPQDKTIHSNGTATKSTGSTRHHAQLAWQPYPLSPFIERLDWVLDLFGAFRGAGWNWRTSALPPPPKWVQEQLHRNAGSTVPKHSNRIHASQAKSYATRSELLKANAVILMRGYLGLDALKTVMMYDPYFWGLVDSAPPLQLPDLISHSAALTQIYRALLFMAGIIFALQSIYAIGALFFAGLLGPRLLGARGEAFLYPDIWGPFSAVLDNGILGWWSNWWHQTFRFGFDQPSRKIAALCGLSPKTLTTKLLQLSLAFATSGALHAAGSVTLPGETSPLRGAMACFLWQFLGIALELIVSRMARATRLVDSVPTSLKRTFTLLYVHLWLYLTMPLICDDITRGGLWLVEPVPVSLFRGLGLGADARDGWWCWGGRWLRWHQGNRWWNSGIAV